MTEAEWVDWLRARGFISEHHQSWIRDWRDQDLVIEVNLKDERIIVYHDDDTFWTARKPFNTERVEAVWFGLTGTRLTIHS